MRVTIKIYSKTKPKGFVIERKRQLKQEKIVALIDNILNFRKNNRLNKITIELHRSDKKNKGGKMLTAKQYLEKHGYKEGMVWTLDNVERVCEQYHNEVNRLLKTEAPKIAENCEMIWTDMFMENIRLEYGLGIKDPKERIKRLMEKYDLNIK